MLLMAPATSLPFPPPGRALGTRQLNPRRIAAHSRWGTIQLLMSCATTAFVGSLLTTRHALRRSSPNQMPRSLTTTPQWHASTSRCRRTSWSFGTAHRKSSWRTYYLIRVEQSLLPRLPLCVSVEQQRMTHHNGAVSNLLRTRARDSLPHHESLRQQRPAQLCFRGRRRQVHVQVHLREPPCAKERALRLKASPSSRASFCVCSNVSSNSTMRLPVVSPIIVGLRRTKVTMTSRRRLAPT